MSKALEYARQVSEQAGVTITPTHLVLRCVGLCLREFPQANATVRRNRVYQRKRADVFCHVAVPGKKPDLSGLVLRDVDCKPLAEIARELQDRVRAVRRGADPELARTRRMLHRTPSLLYRPMLRLIDFFHGTLNWNLRWLGIPQDPFGGVLVTSVGSLGISEAFAPLSPISRTPAVIAIGKVEDKPVARDGRVVIRPVCVLCGTFDHRVMDGYLLGKMAKFVTRYFADPQAVEKRLGSDPPDEPEASVPEAP
jgi:pyruvate dehydrogenase E2 component (dihydrolipoamide acetyltransferase)